MMRSLCLWNFMDFAHGQIYSSGSPDMEWPVSYVGHAFQTWHVITSNKCVQLELLPK